MRAPFAVLLFCLVAVQAALSQSNVSVLTPGAEPQSGSRARRRRPPAGCHRAARPRGDRREEAAGRRHPRRPRRPHPLPEGDRQPRRVAGHGVDDERHDLRPRLAHQGRGDDDERDDAGGAGQGPADRPGSGVRPRLRALRQGRHHDPPSPDARVGAAPGRRPGGDCGWDRIAPSRWRSRRCRRRGRASASSTATSTSSCSATSSGASAASRSTSSPGRGSSSRSA